MVGAVEKAYTRRLRVYNWNQKIEKLGGKPSGLSDTEGLFLFLIGTDFTKKIPNEGIAHTTRTRSQKVVPFDHRQLLSRDSTEMLSRSVLSASDHFLPETVRPLGTQISDCLLRLYRFSPDRLLRPVSPRIVVVIEVSQTRIVEYCSREEMGGMEYQIPFTSMNTENSIDDLEWDPWDWVYDLEPHRKYELLWNSYTQEVLRILHSLTYWLGVKNFAPIWPITVDDPLGFVLLPVAFPSEAIEESHDGTCAVCLEWLTLTGEGEAMEVARTPCNHIFHLHCIDEWLGKTSTCPMCRFLLPYGAASLS
ncbi:hypothetical protein F2P56_008597 [Juglans regia]|uniref:RING-type E3 ubiquitin transferase n=1 Tax=Juglans regia TaxID=51240 RepID=A0A834D1Y6_JUGRE|nr:hypothetical protein F2P56_008597 [Juglans regia]